MSVWLEVARAAAGINILLLVALGSVWLRNYRRHGARHTLGLLVFAAFLLVENGLWLYFYTVHPAFVGWFANVDASIQVGMTFLCVFESLALLVLVRVTWL